MDFISGADRQQMILLPDCVDDYIGEENAVRVIDAYVNSLDLQTLGFSRPKPRDTGRPIYNPKDLLKLYVYGYMNRVRSSRRLEAETQRNLEVIWMLGKLSPDHKTIATFRRDNTAALKNVFRDFVRLCVKLGLYGREMIAIDGSKFKAVNAQDRNFCEKKLQYRLARIETRIEEYLHELEDSDSEDVVVEGEKSSEEIAGIIVALEQRKERYQGYIQELAQTGESQKSLTDPDSRRMLSNGKMDICYNVQTAVDSAHKLVAEFEVTNDAFDVNKITPMVKRTKEILQAQQFSAVMDAGYDSVQDIVASMSQGIDVHVAGVDFDICVPAEEPSDAEITAHKDGRCVYFADRNLTLCPMGKVLQPRFYKRNRYGGFGVFFNYGVCEYVGGVGHAESPGLDSSGG